MRIPSLIAALVLLVFPALPAERIHAQQAKLSGRLIMPVLSAPAKRVFKRDYRMRRSGRKSVDQSNSDDIQRSPFRDVVVSVHPRSFSAKTEPLPEPIAVDQLGVAFEPRVLPIPVGSAVEFINRDPIYHNVFSLTPGAKFDIGRKPTGVVYRLPDPIAAVGEIHLFCDIHPQMNATILSLDTPYYTQPDAAGQYEFEQLLPGTYELRIYHPDLAPVSATIEIEAEQEVVRDITMGN